MTAFKATDGQEAAEAPLLDHDHLARQTFGDVELAQELLDLFAEQCRRLLPGIVERGHPASERADLAHTLKGSALGIGADRIAQRAARMEDRLRTGVDTDDAEGLERAVADTLAILPKSA